MITFETVTKKNLEQAITVQNQIFANQGGYDNGIVDLLKGVSNNKPDKDFHFIEHYLAKDGDQIVGCSGLYSYHNNPQEAWLSWFGVLPAVRKNGYGQQILNASKELAKQKGFTTLRLYTSGKLYPKACKLYEKTGFTGEKYTKEILLNLLGVQERIYSISLTENPVKPWNNQRLHIVRQELFNSMMLTQKKKDRLLAEVLNEKD